jgi:hypothetical protein
MDILLLACSFQFRAEEVYCVCERVRLCVRIAMLATAYLASCVYNAFSCPPLSLSLSLSNYLYCSP